MVETHFGKVIFECDSFRFSFSVIGEVLPIVTISLLGLLS